MIARSIQLARAASSTAAIVVLVAFNLLPLAGVLFWHWNVATLLVLYWLENGIVGLYNIPKILLARGTGDPGVVVTGRLGGNGPGSKVGLALFFLVHYGIFWIGHGVFVLVLTSFGGFGRSGGGFGEPGSDLTVLPDGTIAIGGAPLGPDWSAVAVGAIGLAISHGTSFVVNYLGRREYLHASPAQQMFAPYGRLVILHLTILFGAFISIAIGSPIGAVVVLVLLKTALDLALHVREHDRAAPRGAA